MKGADKKKHAKNVKVFKGGGKNSRRDHLRAGNRAYNAWMKAHKTQTGLDGTPQGKHDARAVKGTCNCGGCINARLESPDVTQKITIEKENNDLRETML